MGSVLVLWFTVAGRRGSYRPGGRLGCAGLLEGHVEGVGSGVICIGRDGRRRGEGIEGGAGLGVGRRRGHVVLSMLVVVGAGGGRAGVLLDAVQEAQVGVLRLRSNDRRHQT